MSRFPLGAAVTLEALSGDVAPTLHGLRSAEPVSWVPVLNAWFVTRRDLAVEVMRDAGRFTVDHPAFSTAQVFGPSMLSVDGDAHRRFRTPFEPTYRRPVVRDELTDAIEEHVDAIVDSFAAVGETDLRVGFAGPVAARTMASVLGLDIGSVDEMLGWYSTFLDAITAVTAGEPIGSDVVEAFAGLRARVLAGSVESPGGLTDNELVSNLAVSLFGGVETTEGTIATALFHLLSDHELRDAVAADVAAEDLSLIYGVVEEALRIEPAAAVVDRYATADAELGGVAIAKGDLVSVSLTAANRDPAVFVDPDHFDPRRENASRHLTFAQGPHVCLGLHLARLETSLAIAGLLRRLPSLTLGSGVTPPTGLVFRKPQVLPAIW